MTLREDVTTFTADLSRRDPRKGQPLPSIFAPDLAHRAVKRCRNKPWNVQPLSNRCAAAATRGGEGLGNALRAGRRVKVETRARARTLRRAWRIVRADMWDSFRVRSGRRAGRSASRSGPRKEVAAGLSCRTARCRERRREGGRIGRGRVSRRSRAVAREGGSPARGAGWSATPDTGGSPCGCSTCSSPSLRRLGGAAAEPIAQAQEGAAAVRQRGDERVEVVRGPTSPAGGASASASSSRMVVSTRSQSLARCLRQ